MPQLLSTPELRQHLQKGQVIPAHPLALTAGLKLDERRQRALTRYYCAAGAGGVAVGVHTTQFELHQPQYGLLEPVLELASATVDEQLRQSPRPFVKVAGIVGDTRQAVREAEVALAHGYDAGLLGLRALAQAPRVPTPGALPPRRRGDPRHRFLSATGGGGTASALSFLARICRNRECRGDQDRAV